MFWSNIEETKMKKLFFFILIISIFCFPKLFSENPTKLLESPPKYILFDNFDVNAQDVIKYVERTKEPLSEYAYWVYLSDPNYMPDIASFAIKKPFNDATLAQYNITDFDVAIFPMGDNKLNTRVGNANVLKVIKDMIAAGKNVLITGRKILWYAFDPASPDQNPEVQDFLINTLGIDYLGRVYVSKIEGSQVSWWSFNVRGAMNDPVGQSIIKWCNIGFRPNPNEVWWPLVDYLFFDAFKTRDKDKYPPVDHFIRNNNAIRNDTLVGIRTEIGQARICFWSMGFEAFAGDVPRAMQLARAMYWLKGNIAPDGAAYDVDPLVLEFGEIKPDSSTEIDLTLESTGKLDLVIEEIELWDNPDNVYEIVSGKITSPKTLKKGETHTVRIRFSPKDKISYHGQLSIKTNALYMDYRYIDLWGYGGGIEAKGPIISTNFGQKIDFGKVKKGQSKIDTLIIKNIGDQELVISEFNIDTTYLDFQRFDFAQTLSRPIYIQAGDSVQIKVRFSAATLEERVYKGRIHIVSNSKVNNDFYIELEGEIEPIGEVAEPINPDFDFTILPNISDGNFRIQLKGNFNINQIEIGLYNTIGKKIASLWNGAITGNRSEMNFTLNLPASVYFVAVRTGTKFLMKPLVLIK